MACTQVRVNGFAAPGGDAAIGIYAATPTSTPNFNFDCESEDPQEWRRPA